MAVAGIYNTKAKAMSAKRSLERWQKKNPSKYRPYKYSVETRYLVIKK